MSEALTPGPLRRLLALLRRASAAVYRAIVVGLLAVVYVLVLPIFALAWRLRRVAPAGWRPRDDRDLASIERLRSMF